MLWELSLGKWADALLNPKASAPDPFFGGHANVKPNQEPKQVPVIEPHYRFYWDAWLDLKTERSASGLIPWSSILRYAQEYRADVGLLKSIVWAVDRAYVERSEELAKAKGGSGGRQNNPSKDRPKRGADRGEAD